MCSSRDQNVTITGPRSKVFDQSRYGAFLGYTLSFSTHASIEMNLFAPKKATTKKDSHSRGEKRREQSRSSDGRALYAHI